MTAADRFPSYRAPQADRQILCVPSWPAIQQQVADRENPGNSSFVEISGVSLEALVRDARNDLIAQAERYTRSYVDQRSQLKTDGPLILTGHQPELVHPGVWLKNFAAAQLAEQVGGTAISLVIDNDLCRAPSIRVPTGTVEQPQVLEIAFDRAQAKVPYEERQIIDRPLWDSFGERISQAISSLVPKPLVADWWPAAVARADSGANVGLALAQARHGLEQSWGSHTLEIPQSQVCQSRPFRLFALHLLFNAARFRCNYNEALAEYRQFHKLRSPAQPLPDLQESEGWIEMPLWIWTTETPERRAVFVRSTPRGLELSDREGWHATLPVAQNGSYDLAVEQLEQWEQAGIKLRTRALITTLYARLFLCDTFIHGIGGAKYDQVTNSLCERFFDFVLPGYVTLSGTLKLPIDHQVVSAARPAEIRQHLRSLRYHPERYVDTQSLDVANRSRAESWVGQKKKWVETTKSQENATERHEKIVAANQALQSWLTAQRAQLDQELSAAITQTHTNKLLESREYPFCLFPSSVLQDFLLDFSRSIP